MVVVVVLASSPGDGAGVCTVTVAALLFAAPHEFVTRTQYVVVVDGETVIDGPVAPATGCDVLPDAPTYH